MNKGKRDRSMSRSALAFGYLYYTEPSFLQLAKDIEAHRGQVPDEVLNDIHVKVLLGRLDGFSEILGVSHKATPERFGKWGT
jgi:hypothetical protein